jgi:Imm-5 like putative immunity protein
MLEKLARTPIGTSRARRAALGRSGVVPTEVVPTCGCLAVLAVRVMTACCGTPLDWPWSAQIADLVRRGEPRRGVRVAKVRLPATGRQVQPHTVYRVILPKDRDPRFITIRRGGMLTDSDHRLLALWAAACAEHVLHRFESVQPSDPRPRQAIEKIRAWTRGEVTMTESRTAGGHAMGAARKLSGAARHAAYAAGQAAVVAHVAAHELGPAAYAIKAARAAAPGCGERAGRLECLWQREQLPGCDPRSRP